MTRSRAVGTRVARRVLGLFLLCALLPVAVVLLVSYQRVQSTLVSERIAQLGHAAESYATSLLERLQLAGQLTQSIASHVESAAPADASLGRYFRSIEAHVPGAPPRTLLGDAPHTPRTMDLPASSRPHLVAGEAVLWLLRPATGRAASG